jgi:KTSC domain
VHRIPVDSSAIRSVGYDAQRNMLEIQYAGGGVYRYLQVPPDEHERLMRADSLGRYVNARIRNRYPSERVAA